MLLGMGSLEAEPEARIRMPVICQRGVLSGEGGVQIRAEAGKSEVSAGPSFNLIPRELWSLSCIRVAPP